MLQNLNYYAIFRLYNRGSNNAICTQILRVVMIISYAFAIFIPLIFLYIIWSMEIYSIARNHLLMVSFGWGMVAFLIALIVQNTLLKQGIVTFSEITIFSAPILEEVLKVVLLIWLMHSMTLNYAIDGTAYGFSIGTGFAVTENLFYISLNPSSSITETLIRVFSVSLMHAFTSGVVGTIIGSNNYQGVRVRVPRMVLSILFAIIIHGVFNLSVSVFTDIPLAIVGIAIGAGGIIILGVIIRNSLDIEKTSINRHLSFELSSGELQATLKPNDVANIIRENIDSVGERRAKLIVQYVNLQARRGILSKTLSLNQRTKFNRVLEQKLEIIKHQLRTLRGEMGLYNWVWLRSALPSDESDIWSRLDSELDTENSLLSLLVELNRRQEDTSPTMIDKRIHLLQSSELFQDLTPEDLYDLALLLKEKRVHIGGLVLQQGQDNDEFYIVERGRLIVSVFDEEGTETIVSTYSAGDHFGELSMLDNMTSPTQVMAVDDVVLHVLSRKDFIMLIYAKADVGLAMIRKLAGDIRQRTQLIAWINKTTIKDDNPNPDDVSMLPSNSNVWMGSD